MEFINFLLDNWQYFSVCLIIVLDVFLFIFGKNKTQIVDDGVYSLLIELVRESESLFKNGEDKLDYVVDNFLARRPCLKSSDRRLVVGLVENILSTPQKKGDNYGSKK